MALLPLLLSWKRNVTALILLFIVYFYECWFVNRVLIQAFVVCASLISISINPVKPVKLSVFSSQSEKNVVASVVITFLINLQLLFLRINLLVNVMIYKLTNMLSLGALYLGKMINLLLPPESIPNASATSIGSNPLLVVEIFLRPVISCP